jgi:hypothetical protein
MSVWTPDWRILINSVEYTSVTLANLVASSGRRDIYAQPPAGYCNVELINTDGSAIEIFINDGLTIEVKNSAGTFIPIFGGFITDIEVSIRGAGNIGISQSIKLIALGALARLPRILTDGVLTTDFDGDQIAAILNAELAGKWNDVPAAETWAAYNPTTTWANAESEGIGEIDQPGNYELENRSSDRIDVYSLISLLATSGLGYIYEDSSGRIGYADSTHRSQYLVANGYVEVSANDALAAGIKTTTRSGDIRNSITLRYGNNSASEVSESDAASISIYGSAAQIITTTLKHKTDAENQADFYLTLRATPQPIFDSITFQIGNPEISNTDRDALIGVFMGMPMQISDLPSNMDLGVFQGFVEGWTITAGVKSMAINLNLSPVSYSLQAMKWNDVGVAETWNTLSATMTWQEALIVQ